MTPENMGGAPTAIPSNDWWTTAIGAVKDYQLAKLATLTPAQGGKQSSNAANIPPGQQGVNAQAASTPGGKTQIAGGELSVEARAMVMLVIGALVLVLLFSGARK